MHTTTVYDVLPIKVREKKTFKPKKAGFNGHHFFLILDESGSMGSFKKDTIGGVNNFIREQADKFGNNAKITIVTFEGQGVRFCVDGIPATEIKEFTDYSPLGSTNLLDAIGLTLTKINDMLGKSSKKDRPSVYVQIITDGEENSSTKYTKEEIQGMISRIEDADWLVSYVGANVDAFSEARGIGINLSAAAGFSAKKMSETFEVMNSNMAKMSAMRSAGFSSNQVYASGLLYTNEEKLKMSE